MLLSNGISIQYHNFNDLRQIPKIHAFFDAGKDVDIDFYAYSKNHYKEFLFEKINVL